MRKKKKQRLRKEYRQKEEDWKDRSNKKKIQRFRKREKKTEIFK